MYRPKTKNDYEFDELTSCMQKSIRRSEAQLAFNCARELLANTPHYVRCKRRTTHNPQEND